MVAEKLGESEEKPRALEKKLEKSEEKLRVVEEKHRDFQFRARRELELVYWGYEDAVSLANEAVGPESALVTWLRWEQCRTREALKGIPRLDGIEEVLKG